MKTIKAAKRMFAAMCIAVIATCALAGSAFAATVQGADFHGSGSVLESGNIDVLNVDGTAGETVFLTVKFGRTTIARSLPYVIGADAADGDKTTWAGVATLDIEGLGLGELNGAYTIEAYADRIGKELLYSGAIYGVYADLPDGSSKLIGTRTANADELATREFSPDETLYTNGITYRLVGESLSEDGSLHFTYEEYDEATTIDGVVKYTNAAGETVASTKIPGLAYGEEREVEIPAVITTESGDVYRTVFFRDSVVAKNPGQTSFSVYCTQMSEADKALAGYYLATINMVDDEGNVIASDSVDVTGEFVYTCPSAIYKTEMVNGEAAVITYEVQGDPVLYLSAAKDGVLNRERTITVKYSTQPLDAVSANVTINMLDGSKRINDKDRTLGTQSVVADDANPTVVPDSQIEINGAKYNLVGDPSDYEYTLHKGMVPSIDAYYVPEGYQAPGAYDVTVNYVNFLTGAVIESHSYTTDPDENARITIETPTEFSADGVNYVRLAGQEADIQHSYYSGIAAYTVYYRDVNDTLSSGTVINTIRVVYADGTTTGGAAADATTTLDATAAAVAEGATALQLNAARTYNVLDGEDNNATLTNEEGVDSNTERIEDDATPLASGFDKGGTSTAAGSLMAASSWALPVGIGAAVVIIAVIAFLAIRRRKNDDMYEM